MFSSATQTCVPPVSQHAQSFERVMYLVQHLGDVCFVLIKALLVQLHVSCQQLSQLFSCQRPATHNGAATCSSWPRLMGLHSIETIFIPEIPQ